MKKLLFIFLLIGQQVVAQSYYPSTIIRWTDNHDGRPPRLKNEVGYSLKLNKDSIYIIKNDSPTPICIKTMVDADAIREIGRIALDRANVIGAECFEDRCKYQWYFDKENLIGVGIVKDKNGEIIEVIAVNHFTALIFSNF